MIKQDSMMLSSFSTLYDIIIGKDNFWRVLNEMVDFDFIYEELQNTYCTNFGRPAENPILMFKYLLLKSASKLSDRDLINKSVVDMEMKYFLGYAPEETEMIDPSLLSKFRHMRLKDTELLDLLINKTVEIALEKGVIEAKNKIIVDSTHTNAMYHSKSGREELLDRCKALRKAVYSTDAGMHEKMPDKPKDNGKYEETVEYCKKVIEIVREDSRFNNYSGIQERLHYLEEGIEDCEKQLEFSKDEDAKVGHKTTDSSFFGYKTHIAETPERIITAATVTTGEKHDGKQLVRLVEKSEAAGIEVEAVIGDGAYSESDNIKYCKENKIKLAAKLSDSVVRGNRKKEDEFEYNKDAKMFVCPAGHMAVRKANQGSKKDKNGSDSRVVTYYFDVEKCKHCPLKEGCYKPGSKTKTYSVKIKSDIHTEYMEYIKTDEYRELYSERYKIEAKNAELKNIYDYENAQSCGLLGMTIQAGSTIFLSNMKRILKLMEENKG